MDGLLEGFPVVIEVPVAWGEMDALGHVNNIVYFRYFESARMECFERLRVWDLKDATGVGPILASTSCRFRIPLAYPDTVSVGTRIADLGEDRFTMHYRVVSHRHRKLAAEGEGVVVAYDYREGRKSAVPAELRQRILELG